MRNRAPAARAMATAARVGSLAFVTATVGSMGLGSLSPRIMQAQAGGAEAVAAAPQETADAAAEPGAAPSTAGGKALIPHRGK